MLIRWVYGVESVVMALTFVMAALFYFTIVFRKKGVRPSNIEPRLAVGIMLTLGLLKLKNCFPGLVNLFLGGPGKITGDLLGILYFLILILSSWGLCKFLSIKREESSIECHFLAWNTLVYAVLGAIQLFLTILHAVEVGMAQNSVPTWSVLLIVSYWGLAFACIKLHARYRDKPTNSAEVSTQS